MSEHGLGRDLADLRRRIGPALCSLVAPCATVTTNEIHIMLDGREERTGAEIRPLCGPCPERESRRRRIRHVEVVLDYRNAPRGEAGEAAASAATMPDTATDHVSAEHRTPSTTDADVAPEPEPGDGLPAAWGPDHPARLALQGREPPPPRRRGNGGPTVDPADFGL